VTVSVVLSTTEHIWSSAEGAVSSEDRAAVLFSGREGLEAGLKSLGNILDLRRYPNRSRKVLWSQKKGLKHVRDRCASGREGQSDRL
jgi:hypothetical protein